MNAICLYGTATHGHGWLAQHGREVLGNGELREGRGLTDCVFAACEALEKAGANGDVEVYAPGGERMAITKISRPGYYGNLKWGPAKVWVLDADQLAEEAAAEEFDDRVGIKVGC